MESRRLLPLPPAVACHAEPITDSRSRASGFEELYADYAGAEHFADAGEAFRSRALSPLREQGPGTWHEQVLAGRVPLRTLRQIGLGTLGRASRDHRVRRSLLVALTSEEGPPLHPALVKEALGAHRWDAGSAEALLGQLTLARWLGSDALELRHAEAVMDGAGDLIQRLRAGQGDALEEVLSVAAYIDEFCSHGGAIRGKGRRKAPGAGYRGPDFDILMRDAVTPRDAARMSLWGVSPQRAKAVLAAPPALSDGAL